jgi:esterase/lipase superfamily enzyme
MGTSRRKLKLMNREYHKWYSPSLHRDMELLVFGHGGQPVIVFPTSMGRFFDYENRGMIEAVRSKYEGGELQAFCVDSVDTESWYNKGIHQRDRVLRHEAYERYLLHEVL